MPAPVFITIRVNRPEPKPSTAEATTNPQSTAAPEEAPAPAGVGGERVHVVERGDTLSAIAQKHYGKASLYMKIFEANRDQLKNPDHIEVGQKLRIPE